MSKNSITPVSWLDVGSSLLNNDTAVVAPGVDDDDVAGYAAGSRWTDTVGGKTYICTDASTGAAVWVEGYLLGSGSITLPGGSPAVLSNHIRIDEYRPGQIVFASVTGGASHDGSNTTIALAPCFTDGTHSETVPGQFSTAVTVTTAASTTTEKAFIPTHTFGALPFPINMCPVPAIRFQLTNGDTAASADHEITVAIFVSVMRE